MRDFLKLVRIQNILIALFAMYIILWIGGFGNINPYFWLGNLIVLMITAGSNILNDIQDLSIDKINRPDRPLITGAISVKFAKLSAFIFITLAIIIGFFVPVEALKIELLAIFLLLFYTSVFKPLPVLGNFVVALVTALLLIFTADLIGLEEIGNIPALLAFGIHFIRELIKDMEDEKGDGEIGLQTLAIIWPRKKMNRLVQILALSFILFIVLLIINNYYGQLFSVLMSITIIPYFIYLIYSMNKEKLEVKEYHTHSQYLKASMFVGLVSIGIGRWFMSI